MIKIHEGYLFGDHYSKRQYILSAKMIGIPYINSSTWIFCFPFELSKLLLNTTEACV